jgi:RNA polymerase sigma-70 factor (ECF subfamily)
MSGKAVNPEMPKDAAEAADIKDLIQRAQAGEAEAISEIYRRHASQIFRFFFFRLKDQSVAEDLAGEVFLRMVQGLPRYKDYGVPIAAWLFRMARDRLVDYYRQHQRAGEELPEQLHDPQPGLEARAVDWSDQQDLLRSLETLTEEQQLVVQLRFVDGLSVEDAAKILNKSAGAVRALQHRALRSLAEKLRE